MHRKRVLILLVVLVLGSLLVATAADSAVRTECLSGNSQVCSSITSKEDEGELGGDDDRWGDILPDDPEELPDPGVPGEDGEPGDDAGGHVSKQLAGQGELWNIQMRMILGWMFWII